MKIIKVLFLTIVLLGLSACNSISGDRENLTKLSSDFRKIVGEDAMGIRTEKGKAAALKLATAYEKFAETHPKDSMAPEYLFISAVDLQLNTLEDTEKSLQLLKRVYTQYPGHKRAAWAWFQTGYIYNDHLHDLPKAKTAFETYLEKYPNHHLQDDARQELKFLGVSTEERLRIIQQALQDTLAQDSTTAL